MPDRAASEDYLKAWYRSAIHCSLEPVKKAARTIKRHAETLLNYFEHPITNAVARDSTAAFNKSSRTPPASAPLRTIAPASYSSAGNSLLFPA